MKCPPESILMSRVPSGSGCPETSSQVPSSASFIARLRCLLKWMELGAMHRVACDFSRLTGNLPLTDGLTPGLHFRSQSGNSNRMRAFSAVDEELDSDGDRGGDVD